MLSGRDDNSPHSQYHGAQNQKEKRGANDYYGMFRMDAPDLLQAAYAYRYVPFLKMRLIEKILDKHRPGWRERSGRRKSFWHFPRMITSFILLGLLWYLLFVGMWEIHLIVFPEHEGHLREFWQEGISFKAFISSFLLVMPLFFPSMGASYILVNLIFWFIPPARKAFENEAAGDKEMTFFGATSSLTKVFIKYLLPLGLGLSLLGALTLSSLK